ncbi:MAG: chain-length determining protein, partial [Mesorhizobium sp.]
IDEVAMPQVAQAPVAKPFVRHEPAVLQDPLVGQELPERADETDAEPYAAGMPAMAEAPDVVAMPDTTATEQTAVEPEPARSTLGEIDIE